MYNGLVHGLVYRLLLHRDALRGRELCNALWALSKLGGSRAWDPGTLGSDGSSGSPDTVSVTPDAAVEALLAEVPRCLANCNGQELSNLLYALAVMRRPLKGQPEQAAGRRRWAATTQEEGRPSLHSCNAFAGGHLGDSTPSATGSLGQGGNLSRAPGPASPRTPDVPVDLQLPVLTALAQALRRGDLGPQALANSTWALGCLVRLGDARVPAVVPHLLGQNALGGAALYSLTPEGLSTVAVGLAWLGARPSTTWCARFGAASGRVLSAASSQAICNMLWGLVSMGRRPARLWLGVVLAEAQRRLEGSSSAHHQMQPRDAAVLLYCCARLGVRPPLPLLGLLMAMLYAGLEASAGSRSKIRATGTHATTRDEQLSPQAMANVSLALWRLGAKPTTEWVEALLRAAHAWAPQFSILGAHMLLSGLEGLGFKPSRRFVARLGAHLREGWQQEAQGAVEQQQARRQARLRFMQGQQHTNGKLQGWHQRQQHRSQHAEDATMQGAKASVPPGDRMPSDVQLELLNHGQEAGAGSPAAAAEAQQKPMQPSSHGRLKRRRLFPVG